jgi:hypothetical protein
MGGVLKRPLMSSILPYAIMQENDDGSNKAECQAFLNDGETFPGGKPVPTVPDAPTSVSAAPGDGSATVTFTAPANNGGSPVTGYVATAMPTAGGAPVTESGVSSPITISGLTNGTEYAVTVAATNGIGTGAESDPVTVTPTA